MRETPIDQRLTSRLGQLLVIMLTPFETPSKALFLVGIRIVRLQVLRSLHQTIDRAFSALMPPKNRSEN